MVILDEFSPISGRAEFDYFLMVTLSLKTLMKSLAFLTSKFLEEHLLTKENSPATVYY